MRRRLWNAPKFHISLCEMITLICVCSYGMLRNFTVHFVKISSAYIGSDVR